VIFISTEPPKKYQTVIKYLKTMVCIILIVNLTLSTTSQARSPHRPKRFNEPTLTFKWVGCSREYHLSSSYIKEYPWFGTFNAEIFDRCALQEDEEISFRNKESQAVSGKKLKEIIDNLLEEVKQRKKTYADFIILQDQDFNRKHACGLLVLKFNDYPFVIKVFAESPQSFTNPWSKGFIPIFLFYMGGGINRHLSGFTRLKNRAYIAQRLAPDPTWSSLVDVPRKWSYIPEKFPFIDITSKNLGACHEKHIQIPGTYVLIADAIEADETSTLLEDSSLAIALCNYLNMQIDPHKKNFMIEKGTNKLLIVDTEHLPTMMGFEEQITLTGYVSWYGDVLKKCGKNMLFSTKDELKKAQLSSTESFHALFFSIPA
jgi:hypothetical protein